MIEDQDEITPSEKDINIVKTEKEVEKLQNEIDKLKNENKEFVKYWWKKPQYIAAFTPIIVGILTLFVAWWSGFLQAQSKLNEAQKLTFEQEKKSNQLYIDSLQGYVDSLTAIISSDRVREFMLTKSIDSLRLLERTAQHQVNSFLNDKRITSEKVLSLIKENGKLQNYIKTLNEKLKEINSSIIEKDTVNNSVQTNTIVFENDIRVYPNPVEEIATLEIKTINLNAKILVFITDKQGKMVYSKELASTQREFIEKIDMHKLSKGAYFLTVYFHNGDRKTVKIIKEN